MIKVSRQTEYAVRIILALAIEDDGKRLSTAQIQRQMLVPAALMVRLVAQLASAGLIRTFAGRDGGLELSRPATEISLCDVVKTFEGPLCISECMKSVREIDCPFDGDCPVRTKWGRVQRMIMQELSSISFADLAVDANVRISKKIF